MRSPRKGICDKSLTEEERLFILSLSPYNKQAARILKVGIETFSALSEPTGACSARTVNRVRGRIIELQNARRNY
jgi:hypothetical protein